MSTKNTSPGIAAWLAQLEAELVAKGQINPIDPRLLEYANQKVLR
jgi:hypothetical protein